MTELTDKQRGIKFLIENLEAYCMKCLKILPKEGGAPVPFVWNRAQKYIHARLEEQKARIGYVRAILLKGRQQGGSTYVGARFYHRTTTGEGQRAFIVAHEDKATSNLFKMVKRFQDHNPLAPTTKASNAMELIFGELDGGYGLATAGSKDVGRSNTARLLHGSETAFWDNAQAHLAGIGNTIPSGSLGKGTEVILESTGNGLGNAFHLMVQAAEAGVDENGNPSEYILIFVPWMWQDEYRTDPHPDFKLSDEDERYKAAHECDMAQMQWRANKLAEYGKEFSWLFDQEYPATVALAFKTTTKNPLISPSDVMLAVKSSYLDFEQPLIIGCDPAGDGQAKGDRTAFAFRSGRTCFRVEYHNDLNTMQIAGKLADYWMKGVEVGGRTIYPDAIFVDKGGLGTGIVDRLVELNIPVIGVMFGSAANNPEIYANKRAEMWWLMAKWFENQPNRIPNDAQLISDICAPMPIMNSSGKKQLESKKEMAKRQIRSPDGGDALALTFAEPVAPRMGNPGRFAQSQPATSAGY